MCLTCITALKKQVLPRLVMPFTGTKELLIDGLLLLDGSDKSADSSLSLMILGDTAKTLKLNQIHSVW